MKVKATKVFFDDAGLHRKNDVFDAEVFIPSLMEAVSTKAEKKTEPKKVTKATKKGE